MRRPIIAGNWKMFKTRAETRAFFDALIPEIQNVEHCDIVVAPPFTALSTAVDETDGTRVAISAQDVHWEKEGAFTGEVSVRMLVEAGCTYTIIGHSERRQYFGETDETVEKKTLASVGGGLKAIVCVGETLSERDSGSAFDVVRRQIRNGLGRLTDSALSHIIVAYEPVWAIGTGRTATPEIAAEMHAEIRRIFAEIYNPAAADSLRILYGGSVKPDNIAALMKKEDIDGALVGGASLDPGSFVSIIKYL
ncbi:MAG: triose-phosphate isomerase [Acidobacteria bacterium]|nr:MAG: triose-phosphate isomerase [Acidobacteriota bacterium]